MKLSRITVAYSVLVAITATLCAAAAASPSAPPQSVGAASSVYVFYDGGTTRKPRSLDSSKIISTNGGPPFDETVYEARHLRWRHWGSSKATGRGKITFCVIGYIPCSTRRATVTLSTVWNNGCGDISYRNYRYVSWNFPGHKSVKIEIHPDC